MKKKKGVVLVMAVTLVSVLFITATGLYFSVTNNINDVKRKNNDFKRFWSAQAANTYGEIFLRNLRTSHYTDSLNLPSPTNKPFTTLNGCTNVDFVITKPAANWVLTSTANLESRNTSIAIDGIQVQTLLKYAECINSLGGGNWTTGYRFWGDVYINNIAQITGLPEFHGNLDVRGGHYTSTSSTSGYTFPLALSKGIRDQESNRIDDDWDTIFQSEFEGSHPGATLPDASYTWSEINNNASIVKTNVAKPVTGKLLFDFRVTVGGIQLVDIYDNGSNLLETRTLTGIHAIMVDDDSTAMYVGVKGEINQEISFVTKTASIHINGDLYYTAIEDLVVGAGRLLSSTYNGDPAAYVGVGSDDLLQSDNIHSIMENNTDQFCGLLAGVGLTSVPGARNQGKILVDFNTETADATPLFVTAGIYSPYGEVSVDNVTNWAGNTHDPNSWSAINVGVPFMTYGSLISFEEGWTSTSGDYGILMNPITDLRMKAGMGPRTYKIMVYEDGTTSFSVDKWVVSDYND